MESILQFFWLLCGAWSGIGSAIIFRYRLRGAVSEGAISKEEADRFAASVLGWIGGPCLLFWVLQFFFAEAASPDFLTWGTPYSSIAGAFCVLFWIVSFTWIWFLGGDRKLSRICILAGFQTDIWMHPVAFRISILLAIAGGLVGMMMHNRIEWPPKKEPIQRTTDNSGAWPPRV